MRGSSPLTRGKQPDVRHRRGLTGLIPAHAGKTVVVVGVAGVCAAHPRSRGENLDDSLTGLLDSGSSPLTRGKPSLAIQTPAHAGLIPAHAGKTNINYGYFPRHRAHPRSRGENASMRMDVSSELGSSPLTRGKPCLGWSAGSVLRLIPAHAGKTVVVVGVAGVCAAHPRSRGENPPIAWSDPTPPGSSPLTRGKRHMGVVIDTGLGLIPAHAGKTLRRDAACPRPWAHPRSRGENSPRGGRAPGTEGSSPLTRGKPGRRCPARAALGLIPAHAGKT